MCRHFGLPFPQKLPVSRQALEEESPCTRSARSPCPSCVGTPHRLRVVSLRPTRESRRPLRGHVLYWTTTPRVPLGPNPSEDTHTRTNQNGSFLSTARVQCARTLPGDDPSRTLPSSESRHLTVSVWILTSLYTPCKTFSKP